MAVLGGRPVATRLLQVLVDVRADLLASREVLLARER